MLEQILSEPRLGALAGVARAKIQVLLNFIS
jgi:hypothetical protein